MMTAINFTTAVATIALLAGCSAGPTRAQLDKKAEFHYKLANGYFYENQIVPALKELTECMKFDEDHPDAHHLFGFIFFGRKEHARAERHFRRALKVRTGFHEARSNLGALLLETRRWRDAIDVLEPLLSETLYSTPWVAHNNMGYAYHKLGKRTQALKHYRLALFHNQKFCKGYNNLGVLYKELGQLEDAIEKLASASTKCAVYAEPHFHLASIYESIGRRALAAQQLRSCVKDGPESTFGRRCQRRL